MTKGTRIISDSIKRFILLYLAPKGPPSKLPMVMQNKKIALLSPKKRLSAELKTKTKRVIAVSVTKEPNSLVNPAKYSLEKF